MLPVPKMCLVCGESLQSLGFVVFTADGNYGSTIWDCVPSGLYARAAVCDKCFCAHTERMDAVRVSLPQPTTEALKLSDAVAMLSEL